MTQAQERTILVLNAGRSSLKLALFGAGAPRAAVAGGAVRRVGGDDCVRRYIGGYAASLGELDVVVMTGGIGEHSATMRERIVAPLAHMGLRLDASANKAASGKPSQLSAPLAQPSIWMLPALEEHTIADLPTRGVPGGVH